MHAFNVTSIFLFLLSFTFLSSASPTQTYSSELSTRNGPPAHRVLSQLDILEAQVSGPAKLLADCTSTSDASAYLGVIIEHIQASAKAVEAIESDSEIAGETKKEIAAKVASIIAVIVQACLEVSLKLGWTVVLALCSKLDTCVHALLVNLNACVGGVIVLVAEIVASTCADIFVSLHLHLCLSLLAIPGQ